MTKHEDGCGTRGQDQVGGRRAARLRSAASATSCIRGTQRVRPDSYHASVTVLCSTRCRLRAHAQDGLSKHLPDRAGSTAAVTAAEPNCVCALLKPSRAVIMPKPNFCVNPCTTNGAAGSGAAVPWLEWHRSRGRRLARRATCERNVCEALQFTSEHLALPSDTACN